MRNILTALLAGALTCAYGPTFAQEKKPEPVAEQAKKADARQKEKADARKEEPKKEESKKKVKKGGC